MKFNLRVFIIVIVTGIAGLIVCVWPGILNDALLVSTDEICHDYQVITLDGVPYAATTGHSPAVIRDGEFIGYFERQHDGDIWLSGIDTSVKEWTDCLKYKGFTPDKLKLIPSR